MRAARPPVAAGHDFAAHVRCEDFSSEVDAREVGERLWDLAARILTREQHEALWLRYVEELDAAEIGRVLGRRPGAVRVLLYRARGELARRLDPELAEEPAHVHEPRPALEMLLPGEALEGGTG